MRGTCYELVCCTFCDKDVSVARACDKDLLQTCFDRNVKRLLQFLLSLIISLIVFIIFPFPGTIFNYSPVQSSNSMIDYFPRPHLLPSNPYHLPSSHNFTSTTLPAPPPLISPHHTPATCFNPSLSPSSPPQ